MKAIALSILIVGVLGIGAAVFIHEQNREDARRTAELLQLEKAKQAEEDAEAARKHEQARQFKTAILDVLDQVRADAATFGTKKTTAGLDEFSQKVTGYDVSLCPKSFQRAWVDFSTTWQEYDNAVHVAEKQAQIERQRGKVRVVGDIGLLLTGAVTGGLAVVAAGGKAIEDQKRGVDEIMQRQEAVISTGNALSDRILNASAEVKKAAIAYGVQFHPQKQTQ